MQRLEDLNKKELSTPGKKTFSEFVKLVNSNKSADSKKVDETTEIRKETESIENQTNFSNFANSTESLPLMNKDYVHFSNPIVFSKIFENFSRAPQTQKPKSLCVVTGLPAKYFDPLSKQPYANKEAFKLLRERYFQKEEDSLLFRIQTLSDLASQKKEKLKKILLTENSNKENPVSSKNILNIMNKYGILKNEPTDIEKKVISRNLF